METINFLDNNIYIKNTIYNGKLLVFSSFMFLTNVLTAIYKASYIYSFLFLFLTRTSILYHYNDKTNVEGFFLDQIAIYCVVIYGFYLLFTKIIKTKWNMVKCGIILFIFITFILSVYLFYYGFFTETLCYDKNKYISNMYHCLLHLISSLGNHLIIFLI
jgi:hypothetical protein